ncbi:fungal-specific transcription factor domain-containing protein [Exophiala viscosa]|uniref:fungal-specific transcription factor domain-containing protein n=1 Tax=Exophiala viscosa TaxID=2486360 RepID=UPI0021A21E13|nr:fungal-specific transcription factor domain-containing protein [Exophiala viscosa]
MSTPLGGSGFCRPIISEGEPQDEGRHPPGHPVRSSRSLAVMSRIVHACDRCRVMRTKCSGGDRCTKCVKDHATCIYGDRKRERNKKELVKSLDRINELEGEVHVLLSALRSVAVSDDFDSSKHRDTVDLLSRYSAEPTESGWAPSNQSSTAASSSKQRQETFSPIELAESRGGQGENDVSSAVGSPGRQGELASVVDLDSGAGVSGFVGAMSELFWIRRVFETLHKKDPSLGRGELTFLVGETDLAPTTTPDLSFFMDESDLLAVDEDFVDPYEWPPAGTTVLLSEAYFHATQGIFPFVLRQPFLETMSSYRAQNSAQSQSQRCWLAMANLVWAIGSKWLQITKLDRPNAQASHLLYYARARALGLDHRVVSDHPDIDRVQGIGLLAFYLLINGSITRAWNTLGSATRHATALGLHLTVTDTGLDDTDRERRARTWYSLYSLEILIAEMTGRPKSISLSDVTISIQVLQGPLTEETKWSQQNDGHISPIESRRIWLDFLRAGRELPMAAKWDKTPGMSSLSLGRGLSPLYFPHRLYFCHLSDRIATQLYSGTSNDSWSQIQRKISELQTDLSYLNETLPDELRLQSTDTEDTDPRARIELAMYYYSLQMILHRPCLCEIVIDNQSEESQEFNQNSARRCVSAAMSLLDIIPDNPTAHEVYQYLPWWTLFHYVAQATAVLMLEMALDCQHFQDGASELMKYLRKSMSYIWCMTSDSLTAYRAWRVFRPLLSAIRIKNDPYGTVDIPEEAPRPKGWTESNEASIRRTFLASRTRGGGDVQAQRNRA